MITLIPFQCIAKYNLYRNCRISRVYKFIIEIIELFQAVIKNRLLEIYQNSAIISLSTYLSSITVDVPFLLSHPFHIINDFRKVRLVTSHCWLVDSSYKCYVGNASQTRIAYNQCWLFRSCQIYVSCLNTLGYCS